MGNNYKMIDKNPTRICEAVRKGKPKFKKNRCAKCKYHGTGYGYTGRVKNKMTPINCNYSGITKKTCLRLADNRIDVYDIRGEDYYNCLLFEEGNALKDAEE